MYSSFEISLSEVEAARPLFRGMNFPPGTDLSGHVRCRKKASPPLLSVVRGRGEPCAFPAVLIDGPRQTSVLSFMKFFADASTVRCGVGMWIAAFLSRSRLSMHLSELWFSSLHDMPCLLSLPCVKQCTLCLRAGFANDARSFQ